MYISPYQVCDIGAGAPYATATEMVKLMNLPAVLSGQAEANMRQLQQAFTVGRHVKNTATCGQVYHACALSGQQMDKLVSAGRA